ncbi:hypothetical protein D9M71_603930 [compost metagenome]
MNIKPFSCSADLAGVQEASLNDPCHRFFDWHIAEEASSVFAAQLKRGTSQLGLHGSGTYCQTSGHRAGEGHFVSVRVLNQRFPDSTIATDNVESAWRQACFDRKLRNPQDGKRGELARLNDHAASGHQR